MSALQYTEVFDFSSLYFSSLANSGSPVRSNARLTQAGSSFTNLRFLSLILAGNGKACIKMFNARVELVSVVLIKSVKPWSHD